jgi:hypothetical protein
VPNPKTYNPGYDFSDFQAGNPTDPLPAPELDTELAEVAGAINDHAALIQDVRRSDGRLKNGIVRRESLHTSLINGFGAQRGAWTLGEAYVEADGVIYGNTFYRALTDHTATNLNRPDVDPTSWEALASFANLAASEAAAAASATASAGSASASASSATASAGSATAAAGSATAAAGSATAAAGSATAAAGSATQAAASAASIPVVATQAEAEAGVANDRTMTPLRVSQALAARRLQRGLILNGSGALWLSRPASGLVAAAASHPVGVGPDGWYGGAGSGGTYTVSTVDIPPGTIPGDPPCAIRLAWAASPTAGSAFDYPNSPNWQTHWEQLHLNPPHAGMGETITNVTWARQTNTGVTISIPMRPIYFYGAGGMAWVSGLTVYTGEVFTYGGYAFNVVSGGAMDATPPTIPANAGAATNEVRGGATVRCIGPQRGTTYEIFEAAATVGQVRVALGAPASGQSCDMSPGGGYQKFVRRITTHPIGYVNTTDYASTSWPSRTLQKPQRRGAVPYFGFAFDLNTVNQGSHFEFVTWDGFGTDEPPYDFMPGNLETLAAAGITRYVNAYISQISRVDRARFSFNGIAGVSIQSSDNIASIVRTGTGLYTVTFASPAPHANYTVDVSNSNDGTTNCLMFVYARTVNGFGIYSSNQTSAAGVDCAAIHGRVAW